MKMNLILIAILMIAFNAFSFDQSNDTAKNPFSAYSPLWNQSKYKVCNTGEHVSYLTKEEKNLIWVLNMIRLSPQLYLKTVLLNPRSHFYLPVAKRDYYFNSLVKELSHLKSNSKLLVPDSMAHVSALCHAYYSGVNGYVGHERLWGNCKSDFYGECCDYGFEDAVNIVTHLLIDYNVPSLGHRVICLSPKYTQLGTSIQPHQVYGNNAVLDFK